MKRTVYILLTLLILPLRTSSGGPLDSLEHLSMELEDVPIANVLSMIAQQNNLNFVLPGNLSGTVTMRLNDVDVRNALEAILSGNGYSYFLKENVIVIKDRKSYNSSELDSRLVTLKYIAPVTAQKALEGRLSEKGKVVILDQMSADGSGNTGKFVPNRILITDFAQSVDRLVELVHSLDLPERNVLIEAKIVEITYDNKSKIGFLWPDNVSLSAAGAFNSTTTSTTSGGNSTSSTNGSSGGDAAQYDPNNGSWTWGKLSVRQLDVVLDFLEQSGNSKLVSNPRITTLENHEAVMKIETIIPIQTINRFTEGAATSDIVTFEDEEVGLSLTVTPRINEAGTITLDVYSVIEDIIGFNGPPDNQKPITSSRSVQTRITVKEGETIVLGGLLKESDIETVQRVPLLGRIPILGKLLFTNKSTEQMTTDLIIFITPTILP